MSVLANTDAAELESACRNLPQPSYEWLRRPETGLVMVRGRIGGTGARFNVGELSVTRCVLRLDNGLTGFSYVQGRNMRHAELAAWIDALMQDGAQSERIESMIIAPLERRRDEHRKLAERKAAATRVEFYTVARGEAP